MKHLYVSIVLGLIFMALLFVGTAQAQPISTDVPTSPATDELIATDEPVTSGTITDTGPVTVTEPFTVTLNLGATLPPAWEDFSKPDFRMGLLILVVGGMLGGLVLELTTLQGGVELWHKTEEGESDLANTYASAVHCFDLGVVARLLIGVGAALVVVLLVQPTTTVALVATAVVAGYAGTSVFESARQTFGRGREEGKTDGTRADLRDQGEKLRSVQESLLAVSGAARRVSDIDVAIPDRVTQALMDVSEAKGIGEAIQNRFETRGHRRPAKRRNRDAEPETDST